MPTPRKHEGAAARQRAYRERRKLSRLSAPTPKALPPASSLPAIPSAARWKALRERAQADLTLLLADMEAYQYQRSEAWQEGDKGQAFQEALDRVEEAIATVQDID